MSSMNISGVPLRCEFSFESSVVISEFLLMCLFDAA